MGCSVTELAGVEGNRLLDQTTFVLVLTCACIVIALNRIFSMYFTVKNVRMCLTATTSYIKSSLWKWRRQRLPHMYVRSYITFRLLRVHWFASLPVGPLGSGVCLDSLPDCPNSLLGSLHGLSGYRDSLSSC